VIEKTWVTILLIVLVPLVPAILLFKVLPSSAEVTGKWKGFPIKLSGAFAGYFVVAILAYGIMKEFGPDVDRLPKYEKYTASAEVTLTGSPPIGELDSRQLHVILLPKQESISDPIGSNRFTMWVTLPGMLGLDGVVHWPFDKIVVEYQGYLTKDIAVGSGAIDENEQKLTFAPIELVARPSQPADAKKVEVGVGQ
jgi:hypothetical protein